MSEVPLYPKRSTVAGQVCPRGLGGAAADCLAESHPAMTRCVYMYMYTNMNTFIHIRACMSWMDVRKLQQMVRTPYMYT